MATFQCTNCKYRFESKMDIAPAKCPYCDKRGTLVRPMKAADILRDVDDMVR